MSNILDQLTNLLGPFFTRGLHNFSYDQGCSLQPWYNSPAESLWSSHQVWCLGPGFPWDRQWWLLGPNQTLHWRDAHSDLSSLLAFSCRPDTTFQCHHGQFYHRRPPRLICFTTCNMSEVSDEGSSRTSDIPLSPFLQDLQYSAFPWFFFFWMPHSTIMSLFDQYFWWTLHTSSAAFSKLDPGSQSSSIPLLLALLEIVSAMKGPWCSY